MRTNTTLIVGLALHFRTPEKTIDCLQSLQLEGIRKAVVVDNSEDGGRSIAAMQDRLSALQNTGLETIILQPGRNLGFAGGVKRGLEYVTSGAPCHILLINSDARLTRGSLDYMRHDLENADIIAPRIAQHNQLYTSSFSYYDRLLGLITSTPKITPLPHASGCCLLIHSNRARRPLFDEDFFFYGEDVMLGFDCQQHDVSLVECTKALVLHATSSSARNGSIFYEYHMNRAHWLLAKKLARNTLEIYIFLSARCITLPLRALVRSFRSRSLIPWNGLWAATVDVLRGHIRSFTPPP